MTSEDEHSHSPPGGWAAWLVTLGVPLLAVLVQVQTTLPFGATDIRLNSADLVLVFLSPLLVAGALYFHRDLYRMAGAPMIAAVALATLTLTGSLFIGRDAIGYSSGWAVVKYAGWYVLLGYLGVGALLGLMVDKTSQRYFVLAFLAFQAFVVLVFIGTAMLGLDTPLNYGPRLTGLAGNPNAMGLYLLCGVGLSIAYLGHAESALRSVRLLLATAAILVAGTLFTRSVAALMALTAMFCIALLVRSLSWRKAFQIVVLAAAIWGAPQLISKASQISMNVFSKAVSVTGLDSGRPGKIGPGIRRITVDPRIEGYRQAISTWRANPLFGAGLGTFLNAQAKAASNGETLVQIHNTPLWLLAETGLAGAGAIFAVYVLVFIRIAGVRSRSMGTDQIASAFTTGTLLMLVAWSIMSLFHELMYQRVGWLLVGMALAMRSPAARPSSVASRPAVEPASAAIAGKANVFFVIGSLQVGGAEIHLSRVASRLARRGYTVTVYNFSGLGELGNDMTKDGVAVIGPPLRNGPSLSVPFRFALMALSAVKLYGLFLFRRPGLVHFFLPQTYMIGAILARAAILPCLVMSRRSLNTYQSRYPTLGRIERTLHRHMTVILGNSRRVLTQLRDDEKVPPDKLGLIYNGINAGRFDTPLDREQKRRELGLPPASKILTIVANLIPYKGHMDLLRALAGVRDALPHDWRLLAVGRDDGIGGSLKEEARRLGVADNVLFLGPRGDVTEILRISDAGVLCSHEEGFSNAVLEGMAAGLPMVVTDVGGNAEAVLDGVNGIVVPPHAPKDLGAAILRLVKDQTLARRMGREGRRRVEEIFSLDTCVSQYDALYASMAAGAGVPEALKAE